VAPDCFIGCYRVRQESRNQRDMRDPGSLPRLAGLREPPAALSAAERVGGSVFEKGDGRERRSPSAAWYHGSQDP